MSTADNDIESIIRRIVREELQRVLRSDATRSSHTAVDERMLFDVAGLAEAVGMSRQYVRNDIAAGRLVATKSGRSKFVIDNQEARRYANWLSAGRP